MPAKAGTPRASASGHILVAFEVGDSTFNATGQPPIRTYPESQFKEISKNRSKQPKKSLKHFHIFKQSAASENTAEKGMKVIVKNMLGFS